MLAANEFREFLTFYPTNARADYAQYKLAMSHFEQMRAPERDQTETREALKEFDVFFQRFPNSPLTPEVRQKWRDARDRLSEASLPRRPPLLPHPLVSGRHRPLPGSPEGRPGFTGRDAVYFYLAESLARTDKKAEAIPYFERLLEEFDQSEHLRGHEERLQALKTQ